MTKVEYEARIASLQKENARLKDSLELSNEKLAQFEQIENLKGEKYHLEHTIDDLKKQRDKLERDRKDADTQLKNLFKDASKRMAEFAFDGALANKMLTAAANVDTQNLDAEDKALAEKIRAFKPAQKATDKIFEYLCDTIWNVRPEYDTETITNIAICLTQNFLTVFYGEPGCGKTSICNIFAEALGLNKIAKVLENPRASRYIPVSVEKGWTSKRDFIGYYNPLSKTFDKNNSKIYDALRRLHAENKNSSLPFVILLDEANLSPMEFYWSDFMNLCDELDENSCVNLGENFIFNIPETLRFVATINNDHTTEELSPRLIDRACIITLPDFDAKNFPDNSQIPAEKIEIISWQTLKKAFNPPDAAKKFPTNVFDSIVDTLRKQNFTISPRTANAIWNYFKAASFFFDEYVALDYAIAQKILPKIHGSDEFFRAWLNGLQRFCAANKLPKSAKILQKILVRGDKNLGYYRFFA